MSNVINLAQKFVPILDAIYQEASVTGGMDAAMNPGFEGVKEVQVMKVDTGGGLGDYSRNNGYPAGDVSVGWDTYKLEIERGREFSIDRMDNEETLGQAFGALTGEFMRLHVIPEIDAYRFAKYASAEGISKATPSTLTKTTVIDAIDEAVRKLDEDQVPMSGRVLYISSDLKPILNSALNRMYASDNTVNTVLQGYNDMPIKWVPTTRFFTKILLNDGTSNYGFAKGEGSADINFMIIYPPSILQVVKFALPKIFDPDTNQKLDSWLFQYRNYHDAMVYKQKAKGLYLHAKAPVAG